VLFYFLAVDLTTHSVVDSVFEYCCSDITDFIIVYDVICDCKSTCIGCKCRILSKPLL